MHLNGVLKNREHGLMRRGLLWVMVFCLFSGCMMPGGAQADPAGNLRTVADDGLMLIDELPRKGASDIIGYDYYKTLPDNWEYLQRTFDALEFRFADAFTDMNREKYLFSMALLLCAKDQEISWLNVPELAKRMDLDEKDYTNQRLRQLMELATDGGNPGYGEDLLEYADGLKAAGFTMKTLKDVCDACNRKMLLDNMDWARLKYLAQAWYTCGSGTLKTMGKLLESFCDYSGDAQSFAAVMSVLKNEGLSTLVDTVVSQSIKAGAGTAAFVYQAVLFGVDALTRLDTLTGSFYEMIYAAEALEACEAYLKLAEESFGLNYEAFLGYEDGRYLLEQYYEWLMYAGANYAGACAVMNKTYSAYIDIGKTALNNQTGGLNNIAGYIDETMIERAEQADQDAARFLDQAEEILEEPGKYRYVMEWGVLPGEEAGLDEDAEPQAESDTLPVPLLSAEEFAGRIVAICEENGIGVSFWDLYRDAVVNQGIGTQGIRTIICDTFSGERNPSFSVTIDIYQDPDVGAEAFRHLMEQMREHARITGAVGVTQLLIDRADALATCIYPDYSETKSNLLYTKGYGRCIVNLVAMDEKDFDQAVRLMMQIEAAAVTEDYPDGYDSGSYADFVGEPSFTYNVLGHEISCRTNIDDYLYEKDGKIVFDYASLAEGLGWKWSAWQIEDEVVYTTDGAMLRKGENGDYYSVYKRIYMLDDEYSFGGRQVQFVSPVSGMFESIYYSYGSGSSEINFTRTDLLSRSMEGNYTYYLNNTEEGTINRNMAVIACYLLENITPDSDSNPLYAVYGSPGPYNE